MAKKQKKQDLLAEALKQIKHLTLALERTDRRKEEARQKKGSSRYHFLIKERGLQMLREGKSKEEVSEALIGVTMGAIDVWAKSLEKPARAAKRQTKPKGKTNRKGKGQR